MIQILKKRRLLFLFIMIMAAVNRRSCRPDSFHYKANKVMYFTTSRAESVPELKLLTKIISKKFSISGTANISQEQRDFASKYSVPLDCTWIIRAQQNKVIYIQVCFFTLHSNLLFLRSVYCKLLQYTPKALLRVF